MGKWLHRLSKVDETNKIGLCTHCGPTKLRKKNGIWRCKKAEKKWRKDLEGNVRPYDKGGLGPKGYRKHKQNECCKCGFIPEHRCQLDVDHIDGNRDNGDPSNLQTLCANCHRLKTFKQLYGETNKAP
jgi:hypothetical protein